jgi:hypothetical protein
MIRKLSLALLAVAPMLALAAPKAAPKPAETSQATPAKEPAQAAQPPDENAASADRDSLVAPLEGGAPAGEAGRGTVPPPDTYTIRSGDTLWDLAGRFLNNPWYWPKIWSYNPDITNPHWIFPGNLLRFFQSGEDAPVQVSPASPGEQVAESDADESDEGEQVKELEDLSRADMKAGASAEEKDAVAVAGPYKIGYVPPRTGFARRDAFVTPRELEESGTIRAAFEEKLMLSTRDRAYASFRRGGQVKAGETYAVYRTIRKVEHPVTGEVIGFQSTILGAARVVAVDDKSVKLVITSTFEPIERGDLLGPWTEKPYRAIAPKPNGKSLDGYIVTSPVEVLTQFAESQVVFVDRGRAEGVEEGNRFVVVRAGDPYDKPADERFWDDSLPKEDVGSLLVVDVKEHASAALVTKSLIELGAGDRVEMRVGAK